MLKLNKILVPTDFSDGAQHAGSYARALAKKFGGRIDLIHVIPTIKYLNESIKKLGLPLDMDKDVYPKMLEEAKRRSKAELEIMFPEELRGQAKVKIDRKPHDTIVEYASEKGYDMIVMGALGSHKNSFLKGSTAEKVIRYSKVPVLAVNGELPPQGVNRVVIPSDFSGLSVAALEYAASMASSFGTSITMLHVMELYGSPLENLAKDKGEPGRGDLDSLSKKVVQKIKKYLNENELGQEKWYLDEQDGQYYLKPAASNDKHIKFNVVVLRGVSAHYEISEYANAESDIIVMATHGRSGFSHLFLGSTTGKVMLSSEVPVLTIRQQKK